MSCRHLYPQPYDIYSCPMGYTQHINSVSIIGNSHNATVSFTTSQGEKISRERTLMSIFNIHNVYGKETLHKQVSSDQELDYVDSKLLPVGKYTIIAFTLSGQISKPLIIEVVNSTIVGKAGGATVSANASAPTTEVFTGANLGGATMTLTAIPLAFGLLMVMGFRRTKSLSKGGIFSVVIVSLGIATLLPIMDARQAFAAYNVSSQGVEAHGTNSSFFKATVEDRFEGVRTPLGVNAGLSTQNNQFISQFTVGNEYMWSQSFVQQEIPTGSTFNNHSCTTQSGSITCSLPSQVRLRGVYNIWTHPGLLGCPSGFSPSSGECVNLNSGVWKPVTVASSNIRVDLNAYQEVQSPGNIYLDQKYRTCTTLSSCTGYTTLYSYTSPQYGNFGSFYYDLGMVNGNVRYGVNGAVGQCGSCDGGFGRVVFGTGTYMTQTYTIVSSNPTAAYRPSGITDAPAEQNSNLCWWNSITNSGGSTPTLTATATYNTACFS